MPPRVTHHAVERLSEEGRRIVRYGLGANRSAEDICGELERATGEKLAPSSLKRYRASKWTTEQEALRRDLQAARALAEVVSEFQDLDTNEVSRGVLAAHLQGLGPTAFADADPLKVLAAQQVAEKLRIERERLTLEARKVRIAEGQLEVARQRLDAAVAKAREAAEKLRAAATAGKSMPTATLDEIARDLFGIGGDPAPTAASTAG